VVAPGDQEFFRVTNAPCRIKEAGAVSDAARHGRPLVGDDLCGLFSHVGKAAVFLASDDSSFVNGAERFVDGSKLKAQQHCASGRR
jgi:enoyl-[acyl-carrier-protein] reductase (NADH)